MSERMLPRALACLLPVLISACGPAPPRESTSTVAADRSGMLPKGPASDFFVRQPVGEPIRGNERPQIANVQIVDLDKDGLQDILVCDATKNRVSWIRQAPKGVYTEQPIDGTILAPAHVEAV